MRQKLLITLSLLLGIALHSQKTDHSLWTSFLKKHVSENGTVNYSQIAKDQSELKAYLSVLIKTPPEDNWSKNEKLAYWINAYNAFTVKFIADRYPIKSIRDVSAPWDIEFIPINGKLISLNNIEHRILRKMDEPRIHFAINCASISCPKLINTAFLADSLEQQLTQVTKEFLSSDKNKISENAIEVSKLFSWFTGDFKEDGSIIPFINRYTKTNINPDASISFLDYDWNLNE